MNLTNSLILLLASIDAINVQANESGGSSGLRGSTTDGLSGSEAPEKGFGGYPADKATNEGQEARQLWGSSSSYEQLNWYTEAEDATDPEMIELFKDAAFFSRGAYFVDSTNGDQHNCEGPDGNPLDFCETEEGEYNHDGQSYDAKNNIDAAAITLYHGKCFVAFRGTRQMTANAGTFVDNAPSNASRKLFKEDAKQNLEPYVAGYGSCQVRSGYLDAYLSMNEFIKRELPNCKSACGNDCPVVLTGHSQGGAAALAAAIQSRHMQQMTSIFSDPYVVTFGAPPAVVDWTMCTARINPNKHFRVVTSMTQSEGIYCDPIPEYSKKRTEISVPHPDFFRLSGPVDYTFNDNGFGDTIHLGHTVLLTKDDDEVSVSTGYGDKTCLAIPTDDNDSIPTTLLRENDFMRLCDGSAFVRCEEDSKWDLGFIETDNDYPPHNIQMYIGLLEEAAENGFEHGRGLNKKCSQDWQCEGSLLCDEDSLTCKQYGSYDYFNCPSGTACLKSITYREDYNANISVEFVLTKYAQNVPIRIVNPEVRNGVEVVQCIDVRVSGDMEIDIGFDMLGLRNQAPGQGSYLAVQFGMGSCDNFKMISNENIPFGPLRPTGAQIDVFVAAQTDGTYCGQICGKQDFWNPAPFILCVHECLISFL